MTTTDIEYDDVLALKSALVGREIVSVLKGKRSTWDIGMVDTIEFVLDNGTVLEVEETSGGCACSNGCFSVGTAVTEHRSVITDVRVAEDYEYGSDRDGSATITLSIYSEGIPTVLVESQGGDNGYYGWGYAVRLKSASDEDV